MSRSRSFSSAAAFLAALVVFSPEHSCRAEWGDPSPAEKRIAEALKAPTEFEFLETPLQDVVAVLKDHHTIQIEIDRQALNNVGVPSDTPITRSLKGISLRSALRHLLRDYDLTYVIADDVLLITIPEESESRMYVCVYPVADLVGADADLRAAKRCCDSLVETMTTCVAPESWESVQGPGTVSAIPPGRPASLVIRQCYRVHEEIAEFLDNLRRAVKMKAGEIRPVGGSALTAAAEAKIAEALESPVNLEFVETPLQDVIDHIEQECKIECEIDARALDDVGVATDTLVTVNLKGVSLASALRLILGEFDLAYLIRDEVLLITTPEEAETVLVTRIYPLDDLVVGQGEAARSDESDHDGLVETITKSIAPESWGHVGGPGAISAVSIGNLEALVILQTHYVHEQVEGLWARREFRQSDSTVPEAVRSPSSRRRRR